MEKISKDEFKNNLLNIGLKTQQIDLLLEYFSLSLCELNNKFETTKNEKIILGLDELNQLTSYLEALNINDLCIFASSLARGQNYYTGNVFEVYEKNGKITCSIGAGGRYDKLILLVMVMNIQQ